MTDPNSIAQAYLSVWNEADDGARHKHIAQGWSNDARYIDPMMASEGHEEIERMIADVRARFPGHRFTLSTRPDGHGRYARFSWTLAPEDGPALAKGTDIVRVDSRGRIAEVVGFLDTGPA